MAIRIQTNRLIDTGKKIERKSARRHSRKYNVVPKTKTIAFYKKEIHAKIYFRVQT